MPPCRRTRRSAIATASRSSRTRRRREGADSYRRRAGTLPDAVRLPAGASVPGRRIRARRRRGGLDAPQERVQRRDDRDSGGRTARQLRPGHRRSQMIDWSAGLGAFALLGGVGFIALGFILLGLLALITGISLPIRLAGGLGAALGLLILLIEIGFYLAMAGLARL